MLVRPRFLLSLAVVSVLATAACGQSGSSGTGGGTAASGSSAGGGGSSCAPVAGQQLVVLEDDKDLQNADNIVPAVNAQTASANPALLPALNAVSAKLTTDQLIELNAAVDVQRQGVDEVAAGWVRDAGITGLQQGSGPIAVGGSNFTESTILATIYADVLRSAGFDARVQAVGNREVYLPALEQGQIQVFPEYLSTATEFLNKAQNGAGASAVASGDVQGTVQALQPLAQKAGLVFGDPSEAADQNAYAVTKAFADEHGVKTLSDLAGACGDGSLVLGGPPECPTRPFCQPGLEQTYGLKFASFTPLDAGGPLTKSGLQQGQVSIGLVFSSDGALAQS